MFMITTLRIFIFSVLALAGTTASGQALSMTWKDSGGTESQASVRPATSEFEGRQLLFLSFESPVLDAKSAGYLEEGVSDETSVEELPIIPVKNRSGKKFLLLWRKAGKVKVLGEDGANTIFTYELAPAKSILQLAPSCRKLQFKVKTVSQDTASFPAMVQCVVKNGMVEELIFSTLEEADWFGSVAFENAGKGERWKSFIYKDISTLGIWEISWGDPAAKSVAKVLIPKPEQKTPIPPKPTLVFQAGLQYLTGKAKKSNLEGDLAGLQIPLSLHYQKEGAWWYLGSGYDLFVLATSSSDAGSNSISKLGAWAGVEAVVSNFSLRSSLGYSSRAMTVPEISVTSTFEAPRLGLDLYYRIGETLTGIELGMAQTSSEGSYEEMTATVFYQQKLLFSKEMRFQVTNTSVKASAKSMDVEASWISLGVAFEF